MIDTTSTEYIGSVDYKTLENNLKELKSIIGDLAEKSLESRKLRYAEVDIEAEREGGRLLPDEMWISVHTIDSNVRREQSSYVSFITQSPRAVIVEDVLDPAVDMSLLEKDLTKKLRYDGWQLSAYANIDGFQANGYGIKETVFDDTTDGNISEDYIQFGDFAFISDTRDLQAVEMTSHRQYFTKTRLIELCTVGKPEDLWNREEVDRIIAQQPSNDGTDGASYSSTDKSLYSVYKNMFRVQGIVHVAWGNQGVCTDWVRKPRPLFVGRVKLLQPTVVDKLKAVLTPLLQPNSPPPLPPSQPAYEKMYPYFLYPYLISENDTIAQLKGRVYLDQDTQEAVTSLLSSTCTKARRSAGLYGSMDSTDPNDDILQQKNIYLKSGCIINKNVKFTQLDGPEPSMFQAINALVSGNQAETSQVNFAERNTKDSRKTAAAIESADQQAQKLSTVQVVLYSIALRNQMSYEVGIIKSRVQAGLIKVNPQVAPLYARDFTIKPSGDVDVIERQQLIQTMMQSWPVYQNTPAAQPFLADMTELMFPINAPKYLAAFQQAMQAQQSAQAQQQQMMVGLMQKMGASIVELAKHPEMFSETGRIHALPAIEEGARRLEILKEQMTANQPKQNNTNAQSTA